MHDGSESHAKVGPKRNHALQLSRLPVLHCHLFQMEGILRALQDQAYALMHGDREMSQSFASNPSGVRLYYSRVPSF